MSEGWIRFWVGFFLSILCMVGLNATTDWSAVGIFFAGLLMGYCLSVIDIALVFLFEALTD